MRPIAVLAVIAIVCAASHADTLCTMDAAEQKDGVEFVGYAAVRAAVDNSKGTEALTDVRFSIDIHSGLFGGFHLWSWQDVQNPWCGARNEAMTTEDGLLQYAAGIVYYPKTFEIGPAYRVERLPSHPDYDPDDPLANYYDILSTVPAGFIWDMPIKIAGFEGSDIELFSTATGELASNELTVTLYDTDPEPQTVPEPATLGLLVVGAVGLIRRRR